MSEPSGDREFDVVYDEDIADASWLTDSERRLLDRSGWVMWSDSRWSDPGFSSATKE